jgi:hypothetical protein
MSNDPIALQKYNLTINGKVIGSGYGSTITLNEYALSCSDEDLVKLTDEWNATDIANRNARIANMDNKKLMVLEAEAFFKRLGLDTYKTSPHGKRIGEYAEFKAVLKAIDSKYNQVSVATDRPTFFTMKAHGDEYRACTTLPLVQFVKEARRHYEQKAKRENEHRAEFALAATLAGKYGISLDDANLVEKVCEADREAWAKAHYPDGTNMHFDECDDCNSWTVGEHRCSCGNRRVYLELDGKLGNWFARPVAH